MKNLHELFSISFSKISCFRNRIYRRPLWGVGISVFILSLFSSLLYFNFADKEPTTSVYSNISSPKDDSHSIAILYLATGRYIRFWDGFYESMEKYFLPDVPKTYFVFTDSVDKKFPANVEVVYTKHEAWPYITLKRFHFFNTKEDRLSRFEYIFFLNANSRVQKTIGTNILPTPEQKLVFTVHPMYAALTKYHFPYERKQNSTAYISLSEGNEYIIGGFFGGRAADFLRMSDEIQQQIDKDLEQQVIARWHDESHLNRYLIDFKNKGYSPILLTPEYAIPEGYWHDEKYPWLEDITDPFIIMLDKRKWGGVRYLRSRFF